MEFNSQHFYHIYNRGNNQQPIFYTKENYLFFLKKMRRHLFPHCQILAYCLMPNHFHWLVLVSNISYQKGDKHSLNKHIGTILSSYTQSINVRYNRSGSLFQQRTKAKKLHSEIYAQTCFHYIHQNPIRAGMVDKMGDWPFSSFPDYSGKRNGTLVSKEMAFTMLNFSSKTFIKESKEAINPNKSNPLF